MKQLLLFLAALAALNVTVPRAVHPEEERLMVHMKDWWNRFRTRCLLRRLRVVIQERELITKLATGQSHPETADMLQWLARQAEQMKRKG